MAVVAARNAMSYSSPTVKTNIGRSAAAVRRELKTFFNNNTQEKKIANEEYKKNETMPEILSNAASKAAAAVLQMTGDSLKQNSMNK